jgi:hypothetical protein
MASSFANEGLQDLWQGALQAQPGPSGIPFAVALVGEMFIPGPSLTYNDISLVPDPAPIPVQSLWSFALQPNYNLVVAACPLNWTLTSDMQGNVYWGVALYYPSLQRLYYTESFPVPFAAPAGGGPLAWTLYLNFGDCKQLAPPNQASGRYNNRC